MENSLPIANSYSDASNIYIYIYKFRWVLALMYCFTLKNVKGGYGPK